MWLTVLGSGSCELRRERSSPAYLLRAGEAAIMLDLGQGSLRRLLQAGLEPKDLSAILISHHHLDHISDLLALLFALKYDPMLSAQARITLAGHPGLAKVMEGLRDVFGDWIKPPAPALDFLYLEPGARASLAGMSIQTAPAQHMETSLAFRLEHDGCSLVYLGDSEASQPVLELAQGADLLVAHCAGTDANPKAGHIYPQAAGRLAAQAEVGALLLSHLYRAVDPEEAVASAAKRFGGPVYAARDLMEIQVKSGKA
ncbi:MAG: ribonuclease Z [Desulfarculaceae bacterium]|jgi:ribonuclease BN (tRNA processing enzyme)